MSEEPEFGKWQPVETMPKEGRVLVWSVWAGEIGGPALEHEIHIGQGDYIDGGDYYCAYQSDTTHWMPLPPPPDA